MRVLAEAIKSEPKRKEESKRRREECMSAAVARNHGNPVDVYTCGPVD
jgi:formiminotetrahydrofolate cyclodeaminase